MKSQYTTTNIQRIRKKNRILQLGRRIVDNVNRNINNQKLGSSLRRRNPVLQSSIQEDFNLKNAKPLKKWVRSFSL